MPATVLGSALALFHADLVSGGGSRMRELADGVIHIRRPAPSSVAFRLACREASTLGSSPRSRAYFLRRERERPWRGQCERLKYVSAATATNRRPRHEIVCAASEVPDRRGSGRAIRHGGCRKPIYPGGRGLPRSGINRTLRPTEKRLEMHAGRQQQLGGPLWKPQTPRRPGHGVGKVRIGISPALAVWHLRVERLGARDEG